jgi:hypothetical protein
MSETATVQHKTALGAAFGRRGIKQEIVELKVALARFRNNGGTFEDGFFCLREAFANELSGKGQRAYVSDGHSAIALPRQPVEGDEGQVSCANDGQPYSAPSSSSNRDGRGQPLGANNGHNTPAPPAREPTQAQRAAVSNIKDASARLVMTIFDRHRTSSGEAWGDVRAHELHGMRRDGALAKAVIEYLGPLNSKERFSSIRELMGPSQFEEILTRVRGQNHAN